MRSFTVWTEKYIIMQKVCTGTKRLSELVPEFVERDALFRLFDDVYDTFPPASILHRFVRQR